MNRKERVLAALRGEPVDHVPVSFWRHFRDENGRPPMGKESAQYHLKFYQETGMDFIKIMYDGFTAPFEFQNIRTVPDLVKAVADGPREKYSQDLYERAAWTSELLKDEVVTYFNLFSSFMLLRKIGDDVLAELLRQDKKSVLLALQEITSTLCRVEERILTQTGCLGLFVCFQGAEEARFSDEEYDEIVRPADLQILETANRYSQYNIAHFCAWDGNKNRLSRWRGYPAGTVNWATYIDGLSLAQGKAYFGGRSVLGGFDNRVGSLLYLGTKEEIQQEARRLAAEYRREQGGLEGLILGADCSILPPFELERFRWVREAMWED